MKLVNRDLLEGEGTLSDRVQRMFGRAPRVLVKAVADWLEKEPRELDHYHLQVVAAAAEAIGDPQQVARLIDEMPITRMHFVGSVLDARQASGGFKQVLSRYPPVIRRRLVRSLIYQGAFLAVGHIPPERRTPLAQELIDEELDEYSKGSVEKMAQAVGLEGFATERSIDLVLGELERRIEKSERGSENRPPAKMPFGSIGDVLLAAIDPGNKTVTPDQVKRAWQIACRCDNGNDDWRIWLLEKAVERPELVETFASELLDEIDMVVPYYTAADLRGVLLDKPELSEEMAARAEGAGANHRRTLRSMLRAGAYAHQLGVWLDLDPQPDGLRLEGSLRYLKKMTSDEMEHYFVRSGLLTLQDPVLISQMKSPSALGLLCAEQIGRYASDEVLTALTTHPAVRLEDALLVASWPGVRRLSEVEKLTRRMEITLRHPMVDVASASSALADASGSLRCALIGIAVDNAATGQNQDLINFLIEDLADSLERATDDERSVYFDHLERLAVVTTSITHHGLLTETAVDAKNESLARATYRNGMVSRELASRLADNFAADHSWWPQIQAASYGPEDVVDRMIEGKRARADVTRVLVDRCLGADETISSSEREKLLLAVDKLADHVELSEQCWNDLLNSADPHVVHRFASHPKCSASLAWGVQAVRMFNTTLRVVNENVGQWPSPRQSLTWNALPNLSDQPLPRTDVVELIDGSEVAGSVLQTPRTARELQAMSEKMGNCIGRMSEEVRDGRSVVAWTSRNGQRIAVVWNIDEDERLRLYEVNTTFNTDAVTDDVRKGIDDLTHTVNVSIETGAISVARVAPTEAAEPTRDQVVDVAVEVVAEQQDVASMADAEADSEDPSTTYVRPAKRETVISLDVDTMNAGTSAFHATSPSVLANPGEQTAETDPTEGLTVESASDISTPEVGQGDGMALA